MFGETAVYCSDCSNVYDTKAGLGRDPKKFQKKVGRNRRGAASELTTTAARLQAEIHSPPNTSFLPEALLGIGVLAYAALQLQCQVGPSF